MIVFVGAAVPGPTTRRRQITNTDMIAAVHDARMRTLHPRLGTGGTFRYVRCDACRTACPDSASRLAAGDHDARAVAHVPERLGVSAEMPDHRDRSGRPDLVPLAGRRRSEEDTERAPGRPVAEVARLNGLLAQFLEVAERDLEENFLAPRAGVRPDRQHMAHGLGGFRVVEFGFSAHRTSLNLDLQLHQLLSQTALAYRVYPSRDSETSCAAPFRPARSNPSSSNPSIIDTDESTGR